MPARRGPSSRIGWTIVIRTPELDTYGPYARASLLADYVELLALKGQPVKRATLADFLADNHWRLEHFKLLQSREGDHIDGESGVLSEQLDEADEMASIVFRQMDERCDVLADLYPFEVTDEAVALGSRVDPGASVYAVVLALTIAHAFQVSSMHRPAELFERTVVKVLQARGMLSAGLAAHRRKGHSFAAALRIACQQVGLKAAPDEAPRRVWAHDEGVDVLCHLGWEEDLRPGTWGFIGQVTVGRSDSWSTKIKEPSPSEWKIFIGTRVPPAPFLAVPHHVERRTMDWLTSKGDAVVLDRLRLVRFKEEIEADEREIIRVVQEEDVEPIAG